MPQLSPSSGLMLMLFTIMTVLMFMISLSSMVKHMVRPLKIFFLGVPHVKIWASKMIFKKKQY